MTFNFTWLPFERLSTDELYQLLALRQRVFVVEQRCAYLDADGVDPQCWHGLSWLNGSLVATARLLPPGLKFTEPAIGRVVTAPEVRRLGWGKALMVSAMAQLQQLYPDHDIRLAAQCYLEAFYRSLGFQSVGAPFDEDGIAHTEMVRVAVQVE